MKKTALITGASSGIGRELARIHASRGGELVLVARRKNRLEQLKKELEQTYSVKVMVIVKDLTEKDAPKEIYDEINNAGIEINYLINNAGFGSRGKFHESNLERDLSMIQLNIIALTSLTRLFLPNLILQEEGRILNVSSIASLFPGPLHAVYFATKAYVTSFSNAIAEELRSTKVSITALLPGLTKTEFAKTAGMRKSGIFQKMASAQAVAQAGYRGMLRGKLKVEAGLTRIQKFLRVLLPFVPTSFILKQVLKAQHSPKEE